MLYSLWCLKVYIFLGLFLISFKGENLSELQDTIAVLAEILDLRSDLNAEVQGHVIESKMDPKVG